MHRSSQANIGTAAWALAAVAALTLAATVATPVAASATAPATSPVPVGTPGRAGAVPPGGGLAAACPLTTRPGVLSCRATIAAGTATGGTVTRGAVTPGTAAPGAAAPGTVTAGAVRTDALPPGLGPADLRRIYNLPGPPAGAGRTVAVVDAMDDPTAEADLAQYRSTFGLAPCTTANGCFRKVNQNGAARPLPAADPGWAAEISLDLDVVSGVCPACHLLLVEATSPSVGNLGTSVNTAVKLGARFVTNAFGAAESSVDVAADAMFYDHPGVAMTAPAGDTGFGVSFPASASQVVAVGGTSVTPDGSPRGYAETALPGGGCSAFTAKPAWQADTFCARRTLVDVAAVADPEDGVAVFDTFGQPGFVVMGGESVSTVLVAAVYALAGTPPAGSRPASFPYAHPGDLFDITAGPGAGPGYDEPTGMGTPDGLAAFRSP